MPWPRMRFSLSSLLFLITIVAVTCGWFIQQRTLRKSLQTTQDELALLRRQEETSEPTRDVFAKAVVGKADSAGGRRVTSRADFIGKRVQVEGIALGQPFGSNTNSSSRWSGAHVSYNGAGIFLEGVDFVKDGVKGKLVRVTGTLGCKPTAGSRFGDIPKSYFIDVESYETIEVVEEPVLLALEKIETSLNPKDVGP